MVLGCSPPLPCLQKGSFTRSFKLEIQGKKIKLWRCVAITKVFEPRDDVNNTFYGEIVVDQQEKIRHSP